MMNFKQPINIIFMIIALMAFMIFGMIYPEMATAAEKADKSSRRAELIAQKVKQEAEQEKLAMQAQFDQQKKALEDQMLSKEQQLTELDKSVQISQRKIKATESENFKIAADKKAVETKLLQTQTQLEVTQKELADLKAQLNQAQTDLKVNDTQRKTQTSHIAQTAKSLSVCEQKNNKLHQFGSELVSLYEKPSGYAAAMRQESFFQLKRVELENILQSYQDQLNEEHLVLQKH
jgi:chromosome segregation ATPase